MRGPVIDLGLSAGERIALGELAEREGKQTVEFVRDEIRGMIAEYVEFRVNNPGLRVVGEPNFRVVEEEEG